MAQLAPQKVDIGTAFALPWEEVRKQTGEAMQDSLESSYKSREAHMGRGTLYSPLQIKHKISGARRHTYEG